MYQLYLGDCLKILPTLNFDLKKVAIVSDPPYGVDNDNNYMRFTNGNFIGGNRKINHESGIPGDDVPFDPTPWLDYPSVILWGYQYWADQVPPGTILVWNKKSPAETGTFLSDGELAWQKGGKGVYIYHHIWHGMDRQSEKGEKTLHPSQKPIALMRWCIQRLHLPKDTLIVDPYCGSGPTLVAAIQLGYDTLGVEISEHHHANAERRAREALAQPKLFEPEGEWEQGQLWTP